MRLKPYLVTQLKSLQYHAVIIDDSEWHMHYIIKRQLKDRSAFLVKSGFAHPPHLLRRLYIIPEYGPWPELPAGWVILRAHHANAYFENADLQALAFQKAKLHPPKRRCFPLAHSTVERLMKINRPEREEMVRLKHYLFTHTAKDVSPGEYSWLVVDEVDGADHRFNVLDDCDGLAALIYTYAKPDPPPPRTTPKKHKHKRKAIQLEPTASDIAIESLSGPSSSSCVPSTSKRSKLDSPPPQESEETDEDASEAPEAPVTMEMVKNSWEYWWMTRRVISCPQCLPDGPE